MLLIFSTDCMIIAERPPHRSHPLSDDGQEPERLPWIGSVCMEPGVHAATTASHRSRSSAQTALSRPCVARALSTTHRCPIDRQPLSPSTLTHVRPLENMVQKLIVRWNRSEL
jgi:hypothetical protein